MRLDLETEVADTSSKKLRGLMFRKRYNKALLFKFEKETRLGASIHAFFVFFPFDVLWLDRDMRVVDLRERVIPFTFILIPREKCCYILELPAGFVKKRRIKLGERVITRKG